MEKFVVSARKYRPQTFDTVVGQEHITTTLKNAIRTNHLAHAFLFCGPRGVGKTTCARILAKTINCQNISSEGEACNTCTSCVNFNEGTSMNIHELDAASNNSVDDIRSLVDQVRFAPQGGRYKVYIIDEVHMLSASAFNAFLKTLEEPPSYAIFILATTEKHKILPTILSRCQIFDFKRITLQDTVSHLSNIATNEGVKAEDTALQLIAQKSEGCMRDALSILDKIVSFTGGELTYPNTVEHLNILDADYYFRLFDMMQKQDLAGAMLLYDDINQKGFEGDMVLSGFAEFLRNLLICKDARVVPLLEAVESFKQRYMEIAKGADAGYLIAALNILNESEIGFRLARNKRLHVELALIRLCYLSQAIDITQEGNSVSKKKRVEEVRAIPFKVLQPFAVPHSKPVKGEPAKLIIEEIPVKKDVEIKKETPPAAPAKVEDIAKPSKLSSLDALRKKFGTGGDVKKEDLPVEIESLNKSWNDYIQQLKSARNPAWASFERATLTVTDSNSFEVEVGSNLDHTFILNDRNNVCEFLKQQLQNSALQFTIVINEAKAVKEPTERPLSAREQYQLLVEQYPLVKELKERLRLDLDF